MTQSLRRASRATWVSRWSVFGALMAVTVAIVIALGSGPASDPDLRVTGQGVESASASSTEAALESDYMSPLNFLAHGPGLTPATEVAYENELSNCMSDRGWQYFAGEGVFNYDEPVLIGQLAEFRATEGYQLSPSGNGAPVTTVLSGVASAPSIDRNKAYLSTLTESDQERYASDFDGAGDQTSSPGASGSEGCQPRAWRAVMGGLPSGNPIFMEEWSRSVESVLTHPDHQAAIGAWAACMADLGMAVDSPDEARSYAAEMMAVESDPLRQKDQERAVATADLGCQMAELLPVRHRLEQQEIDRLVGLFPGLAERAQALGV